MEIALNSSYVACTIWPLDKAGLNVTSVLDFQVSMDTAFIDFSMLFRRIQNMIFVSYSWCRIQTWQRKR